MSVHDTKHEVTLIDGPLANQKCTIIGVLPFAMFQIAGTMDQPIFHLYFLTDGTPRIDETQKEISKDYPLAGYRFAKTYTFVEMAAFVPKEMETP